MNEPLYFLVDLGILPVGADVVLAMTPQVIHPIQLRAALGQPDQLDAHLDGQVLRSPGGMTWIFVQEQRNVPATVMATDYLQERPEVLATLPRASQEQPMAGIDVDCTEDHTSCIEPGDRHLQPLPPQSPGATQRREQQQVRLILEELDPPGRQSAD